MTETVAIVGGGAAGTLSAIHLLASRAVPRVILIERSDTIGAGVAYATTDERHLLNVVAGRMSAYGDQPDHFVDWLHRTGRTGTPETFAPRIAYGSYLRETLDDAAVEAAGSVDFEVVRGDAVMARTEADGLTVGLKDGRSFESLRLVLATGPVPSRAWPLPGDGLRANASWYIHDPWAPGALAAIGRGDRVAMIGTGLTMVDVANSLAGRGARLDAVSRHGLLPLTYAESGSPVRPPYQEPRANLLRLVRDVRGAANAATHWQDVIDALRPRSQELWQTLSSAEQEQFLRHVRRYWEAHRHRIAPESAASLRKLLVERSLRLHAGTVVAVWEWKGAAELSIAPRAGGADELLAADVVINCTGPADAIDREPQPLLASLFAQELARPGPHRLGLAVTGTGEVIGSAGAIFALGALRRGTLWETSAIGEIRAQAEELASAWATKRPKLRR